MVFSDLWAGRAVKTTLAPKFAALPKNGAGLALEREEQGGIPGPPSPHLPPAIGGAAYHAAGPPRRHGRWRAPLGLPPPQGQGGREEEGRRKGRGGKWEEGGPGLGGGGAWVGSMHHPLPWLPPQRYAKIGSF
jgi:hypothetical protein